MVGHLALMAALYDAVTSIVYCAIEACWRTWEWFMEVGDDEALRSTKPEGSDEGGAE